MTSSSMAWQITAWESANAGLKFSPGSGTLDKSLDFECVLEELQTLKALWIQNANYFHQALKIMPWSAVLVSLPRFKY